MLHAIKHNKLDTLKAACAEVGSLDGMRMYGILLQEQVAEWWTDQVWREKTSHANIVSLVIHKIPFGFVAALGTDSLCVEFRLSFTGRVWTFSFSTCADFAAALEMTLRDNSMHVLNHSITMVYDHDVPGDVTFKIGALCRHQSCHD